MSKIRVLVVDDSAVVRTILTEVLSSDADIEVVGTAGTAASALTKFTQLSPDFVTLDVELPDRSGLDLLVDLRQRAPRVPIVMFSSLTRKAAATTLDALARGATDYVTKPASSATYQASLEHIRAQLLPKVKALGRPATPNQPPRPAMANRSLDKRVDILAIGSSTGGPSALADVLKGLASRVGVPVVIVQHMPPVFTQLLGERLAALTGLTVNEAKHGDVLRPRHVYIAPGDFHMHVVRQGTQVELALDKAPPENSCRPAVDVLFRSVASVFGSRALAVVLTGMGQDGLIGCQHIRAAGGQIVVQDEATSVVWGMPGAVATNNLADKVLPLSAIADNVVDAVSHHAHTLARVGNA